jgi:hypothetical protein
MLSNQIHPIEHPAFQRRLLNRGPVRCDIVGAKNRIPFTRLGDNLSGWVPWRASSALAIRGYANNNPGP